MRAAENDVPTMIVMRVKLESLCFELAMIKYRSIVQSSWQLKGRAVEKRCDHIERL